MIRRSPAQAGFTLVEMLIALTIFGMLTAGGVALLSFSVTTQEVSERQLATLGSIRRAGALLTADLAQATPRRWRDGEGQPHPAFIGNAGGETRTLMFVRAGWDNPDEAARSTLQRVEYRLQDGRLVRLGYTHVDGGGASAVAVLIDDVSRLALRYRDRAGGWHSAWAPVDPAELPAAVELDVTAPFGTIRQLFLVGGAV